MHEDGRVRFVCFDLGGVVVRICRSWSEACERADVEVREPRDAPGTWSEPAQHEAVRQYQSGLIECAEYYTRMSRATGGLYSTCEVERIHKAWTFDDYPGMEHLIASLRTIPDLTTFCLSNTNRAHWNILLGRDRSVRPGSPAVAQLETHLVSHELGQLKPEKRIYRRAEESLGARPDQILFFDDTPENVEGARALGWRADLIDPAGDPAGAVISHLRAAGALPRSWRRSGSSD